MLPSFRARTPTDRAQMRSRFVQTTIVFMRLAHNFPHCAVWHRRRRRYGLLEFR